MARTKNKVYKRKSKIKRSKNYRRSKRTTGIKKVNRKTKKRKSKRKNKKTNYRKTLRRQYKRHKGGSHPGLSYRVDPLTNAAYLPHSKATDSLTSRWSVLAASGIQHPDDRSVEDSTKTWREGVEESEAMQEGWRRDERAADRKRSGVRGDESLRSAEDPAWKKMIEGKAGEYGLPVGTVIRYRKENGWLVEAMVTRYENIGTPRNAVVYVGGILADVAEGLPASTEHVVGGTIEKAVQNANLANNDWAAWHKLVTATAAEYGLSVGTKFVTNAADGAPVDAVVTRYEHRGNPSDAAVVGGLRNGSEIYAGMTIKEAHDIAVAADEEKYGTW